MHWSSGDGVTRDLLAPAPFLAGIGDDVNDSPESPRGRF